MSDDSFIDAYNSDFSCDLITPAEKPTIKVLFYTDDPRKVEDNESASFGVGILKKLIALNEPACARFEVKLESRNGRTDPEYGIRKLDFDFLNQYDQVWFFGIHQVNKEPASLKFPGGGNPTSELNDAEVKDLCEWMESGGVLMAGDHANPDPTIPIIPEPTTELGKLCPSNVDHATFMSLGRALGHRVPRAGRLREWQGPPTRCTEDSFNTVELFGGIGDYENDDLESDEKPQTLRLEHFNIKGERDPDGRPHCLFIDKSGGRIEVFPDHMHEGRLKLPTDLCTKEWPEVKGVQPQVKGVQPRPYFVAYGRDKRNGNECPVVAVYDGDRVGRGRIVADSTWHHYLNVNLRGIDLMGGPVREQLGQFYANLGLWLARLETRRKMVCFMFASLADHPLIMEEVGSGILNTGRTAFNILSREASPCELDELLLAATPPELRPEGETWSYPTKSLSLSPLPSKDVVLGAVLQEYHSELSLIRSTALSSTRQRKTLGDILRSGFCRAFEAHEGLLSRSARMTQTYLSRLS